MQKPRSAASLNSHATRHAMLIMSISGAPQTLYFLPVYLKFCHKPYKEDPICCGVVIVVPDEPLLSVDRENFFDISTQSCRHIVSVSTRPSEFFYQTKDYLLEVMISR